MAIALATIGTPVTASRQMTTALSPRPSSGWNFITQSFNDGAGVAGEWVVVHLEDATFDVYPLEADVYANSNFQIPSIYTAITINNQLRAPNGDIYFPEVNTWLAYYKYSDETVYQLPFITPPGTDQAALYSAAFSNSGAKLYLGSQSQSAQRPIVVEVDTTTRATTVLGEAGTLTVGFPRYVYYLADDTGTDYVVCAFGEAGWECGVISKSTGAYTTLLTTSGPGAQRVTLFGTADGVVAEVQSDGVITQHWIADGAVSSYPGSGAPPGGSRNCVPYTNPLVHPPEIDWSRGIGEVLWR